MASIGEMLQEARKKKGLSEEAVAKVLRVKIQRLRDLEVDKYSDFPAHIYARSFLKHYAEYLGLDTVPILEQFNTENPAPERGPVFEITEEQRTSTASSATAIHRFPSQAPSFPLTPTGKAILVATLLTLLLVGFAIYLMPRILPYFTHQGNEMSRPAAIPAVKVEPSSSVSHPGESFSISTHIPVPPLTYSTNTQPTETPGLP